MSLYQWAIRHHVSMEALVELRTLWNEAGVGYMPPEAKGGTSENAVSAVVLLEGARLGVDLFRNNVGVLKDVTGRPVRYGLANESRDQNKILKSGDYIGIDSRPILSWEVGLPRGRFVSREMKKVGWTYTGDEHEAAQMAWALKVISLGGDAAFATGEGTL